MPIHSSRLFKNFFGTDKMRRLFTDETRVAYFFRVEVALAKVEADLGLIPAQAYEEIARRALGLSVNWERLRRDVEVSGYPVLPALDQLGEACGSAGEYLHWGSVARDVADIAFLMQMHDALLLVERDVRQVRNLLLGMAEAYRSTLMMARSDGGETQPVTFGFRCAVWLTEIERQACRLETVRVGMLGGPFGGTTGTLAGLGARGMEIQAGLLVELGLPAPKHDWPATRDRSCEIVFAIGLAASCVANIAATISRMSRNEVRELGESPSGRRPGAKPLQSRQGFAAGENVTVHARLAAQNVSLMMESIGQDHDRDWNAHMEVLVVPQTFLLVHSAVSQMGELLAGLQVFPKRMRSNLETQAGLLMAESVTLQLAAKSGRRTAHRLMARVCDSALRDDQPLRDVLVRTREVTALMSQTEIDAALAPGAYLGSVPRIVEQVIDRAHAASIAGRVERPSGSAPGPQAATPAAPPASQGYAGLPQGAPQGV